jgi:hypothetical protein
MQATSDATEQPSRAEQPMFKSIRDADPLDRVARA